MAPNNTFFRRRRKPLTWLGSLVLVYTIVGFLVLPAIIKSQMVKQLPGITKRTASVQEVKVNPYALSLTIRGLKLTEANGDVFASLGEFYGNFELSSIVRGKFVFSELSVKEPSANIIWQADGSFNFANILEASTNTPSAPKEKGSIPKMLIEKFTVEGGGLDFVDLTRKQPFHTKIAPLHLNLKDFTTQPNTKNPYSFTARTDANEEFAWAGDITVDPMASTGTFKLSGIDLKKYAPYLSDFAKFEIKDGKVDVSADYDLAFAGSLGLNIAKLAVKVSNLQIEDPANAEKVVTIPLIEVREGEASLEKRTAKVGGVSISDGAMSVRRNQDGSLNLLSLLVLPKTEATNTTPTTNAPWVVAVDAITITNFSIKAEDCVPTHPASIALNQLGLTAKTFIWPPTAPVSLSFSTGIDEAGKVAANGTVDLSSLDAALDIQLSGFNLRTVQPYVEQFAKVAITSGTLNSGVQVKFSRAGAPMLKVKGAVELHDLATVDQIAFQDLAKFQSLKISGIDVDLLPNRFHVDEIVLAGLSTSIIITSNKQPNVLAILPAKPVIDTNAVSANTARVATGPLLPFPVELGKFSLEHASFHFADHSIQPHSGLDVADFGGSVEGLSSENTNAAKVNIGGNVDERSTFGISGKVGPISSNMIVDLTVACTNTGLSGFTPYMEKFAGYPLKKGNLSVALQYEVHGKQLKAQNKIQIDQLTLGSRNNSPDATKLPVKLGVALLKDRHGKIELDVPLSGNLDDPKFRIGPIVLQVFVNILTKAATSPFTLLGAMFGGGEEMSYVDFAPGQSQIPEVENAKLDKLAKSLYERPELSLEISGSMDAMKDRPALTQLKLEQQMKSIRVKELMDAGNPPQGVETLVLQREDYQRLLTVEFQKRFGSNLVESVSVAVGSLSNSLPVIANSTTISPQAEKKVTSGGSKLSSIRGAQFLITQTKVDSAQKSVSAAKTNVRPQSLAPAIPPSATNAISFVEMETRLLSEIHISDDDLRDLMQDRARKVQGALLKTGKLGAERLFLLAPKTVDSSSKGETRVNLTLN
ncbi:MAG: uncharacterized protein JWM68_3576 [Verrucomicrobiales bacterium]|nr:uncharacterized protein [Verrucomicrobiales bacterium]